MSSPRVISDQEIAQAAISLESIYDLIVEGFRLQAHGAVEFPPKLGLHPRPGAFIHVMPAYLPTRNLAGTKLVSVYPDNVAKGLPAMSGMMLMADPATGVITHQLDAVWITKIRTAMVSMVSAKLLANPNPVFGVIGATGTTGRAHLETIAAMFPGSRVLVHSRNPERLAALLAEMADQPLELIAASSDEAIVRSCDVPIVCITSVPEPILRSSWIQPGQTILNVHNLGWPGTVLSEVDRVCVDDRRQVLDPSNGLCQRYTGLDPDLELCEVVIGARTGRERPDQTIFCLNYGLAIFDILLADVVLQAL